MLTNPPLINSWLGINIWHGFQACSCCLNKWISISLSLFPPSLSCSLSLSIDIYPPLCFHPPTVIPLGFHWWLFKSRVILPTSLFLWSETINCYDEQFPAERAAYSAVHKPDVVRTQCRSSIINSYSFKRQICVSNWTYAFTHLLYCIASSTAYYKHDKKNWIWILVAEIFLNQTVCCVNVAKGLLCFADLHSCIVFIHEEDFSLNTN